MSGATAHAPEPPPPDADVTAVAAMARGDTEGLAALYGRYAAIMLATARRILGDPRGAEDVVHDVFLEAWRQAVTYDPARGSVRTWLLVRLRSRALDRCRAAALRRTVAELPETADDDDASELPDHQRLRMVLRALPDEQRAVLEHAYFAGLSASEIAAELRIPIGTVKSRLGAALKKLRAALSAGSKERP
ncbi:MAG: sigma-70 family RNA polymerase sigma factor [Myxococcales bacterium]|nr:sigma-70 family RNA polymerase sigma factor [Myxococcales bacterium]